MDAIRYFRFLLAISVLLPGCALALAAGPCRDRVVSEVPSPGGSLKAVLFVRECAGDARIGAHLSILPVSDAGPIEAGNTFVGEVDPRRPEDRPDLAVKLAWSGDAELSVLHGEVRILKAKGRVRGVKIYYGHLVDVPPKLWRK